MTNNYHASQYTSTAIRHFSKQLAYKPYADDKSTSIPKTDYKDDADYLHLQC